MTSSSLGMRVVFIVEFCFIAFAAFVLPWGLDGHGAVSEDGRVAAIVANLSSFELHPWVVKTPSSQCAGYNLTAMRAERFTGSSMVPSIFPGDTPLSIPYNVSRPIVLGDRVMVNVSNGSSLTLHTVFSAYKDYFVLRGDNNYVADAARYNYSQIVRVVCGVTYG